jgi:coatomer subunit gamma
LTVALTYLCEFIEDCEYNNLAVRILHLLGTEGPKTSKPTKYIRYIYNRVVLENAVVRAAAVTALAKFGAEVDKGSSIRASIKVLLTRCLDDLDDEVRDRAAINLKFLEDEDTSAKFIRNSISTSESI